MRCKAARQATMLTAITPDALTRSAIPSGTSSPWWTGPLAQLSQPSTGCTLKTTTRRASIPPEHLLKVGLLMALFSVRSERQFCERLEYDRTFKWSLDLNIMDHSFDHSVFSKNKQRLLDADVAREFLLEIVEQAREQPLLSEEHFSVDGTLLEAWASVKSFRPKDKDPPSGDGGHNREVDFHGERRSNETYRSTTDPHARLVKKGKGKEARLCFGTHVLMDNREGLVVDVRLTPAAGGWERDAAGDAGVSARPAAHHRGRRPRLRHQGFRQGMPEDEGNTPCGAKAAFGHRRMHHQTRLIDDN